MTEKVIYFICKCFSVLNLYNFHPSHGGSSEEEKHRPHQKGSIYQESYMVCGWTKDD